jgi:hypothetical protein
MPTFSILRPSKIFPKLGFLVWKYTIYHCSLCADFSVGTKNGKNLASSYIFIKSRTRVRSPPRATSFKKSFFKVFTLHLGWFYFLLYILIAILGLPILAVVFLA